MGSGTFSSTHHAVFQRSAWGFCCSPSRCLASCSTPPLMPCKNACLRASRTQAEPFLRARGEALPARRPPAYDWRCLGSGNEAAMFADRIEGKWIDAFCEVFARCAVTKGDCAAILSETQSRQLNVHLAEL